MSRFALLGPSLLLCGCGVAFDGSGGGGAGPGGSVGASGSGGAMATTGGSTSASGGATSAGGTSSTGGAAGSGGAGGEAGGGGSTTGCTGPLAKLHPNGTCYLVVLQPETWQDAVSACAALGGGYHLASLTTLTELGWVDDAIDSHFQSTDRVWVGGNDIANEGTFVWNNSETWTDEGWLDGQPNNNGDEDCVEIYVRKDDYDDGFNDGNCTLTHAYLCEAPP